MSDRFFHGYWRLKKEKADLVHELEQLVEYEEDLRLHIEDLEELILNMEVSE